MIASNEHRLYSVQLASRSTCAFPSQCGHPIGDGIDNTVINDDAPYLVSFVFLFLWLTFPMRIHIEPKRRQILPTIHLDGHTIYFLFKSNLILSCACKIVLDDVYHRLVTDKDDTFPFDLFSLVSGCAKPERYMNNVRIGYFRSDSYQIDTRQALKDTHGNQGPSPSMCTEKEAVIFGDGSKRNRGATLRR